MKAAGATLSKFCSMLFPNPVLSKVFFKMWGTLAAPFSNFISRPHAMHERVDEENLTVVSLPPSPPILFPTRAPRTPAKTAANRTVTGAGVGGGESNMTQTTVTEMAPKPV